MTETDLTFFLVPPLNLHDTGPERERGRYDFEPINIYSGAHGSLQNLFRTPQILFGFPQLLSEPSTI